MPNINELLNQAKVEVDFLTIGEVFSLKDLFKGYEWKRIPQGERSTLGTLFRSFAESCESIQIEDTQSGLKCYRIIQVSSTTK